jgi:LacI family transcriptional regulator
VAVGVIDSLEARRLLVPADVSVVGFSDLPIAGAARIGLTTIRQDATAMGETAIAALVARLSDPDRGGAPYHHVFEPVLVVRSTTGPPP